MSIWTQGTELYALVPTVANPAINEVMKIDCITDFDAGGDPADQLEDTCLAETTRSYFMGLRTPGAATINLNADPKNSTHYRIYKLFKDNIGSVKWVVGWSDGTGIAPTMNGGGDDFVLPDTRTWFTFEGYVSDFPFSFAANVAVASAVTVQRSGESDWLIKTESVPVSVTINEPGPNLVTGGINTATLTADVLPVDAAQAITWSSDDVGVATVDTGGVVTAVADGTCNIRAAATADILIYDEVVCTVTT